MNISTTVIGLTFGPEQDLEMIKPPLPIYRIENKLV